jgi:hypothetical protein
MSGKVSVALTKCMSHFVAALACMLLRDFSFVFPLFFSLLPNLLEVMQRASPSFYPKGTCLRWAGSPAAPGGTRLHTRQFHCTREGGKNVLHTEVHTKFLRTRTIYSCTRKKILTFASPSLQGISQHIRTLSLCSTQCLSPPSQNLLRDPNFPSARERKRKIRRKGARRSGPGEEAPNFLRDSAHVPEDTPHIPQETPHDPQGTPHKLQAGS